MAVFIPTSNERDYMLRRSALDLINASKDEEQYTLPTLKEAIYYCYENSNVSVSEAAAQFDIPLSSFHRYWNTWFNSCPSNEPNGPEDIKVTLTEPGRPPVLHDHEETLIAEAIKEYARMKTPLKRVTVFDFVQHYVSKLSRSRQLEIERCFKYRRPDPKWIRFFLRRHPDLEFKSVQVVDERRANAITKINISEHIARLNAVIDCYRINDPHRIWNVDQTGVSFSKIVHRSIRKGLGPASTRLIQTMVRTKGNLDHVTVMPVVSAAGDTFTPVIVYPGKMAKFRKISGQYQCLHAALPHYHLYQRDPAGVDSDVFADWALKFVEEVARFRKPNEYFMLVLDGYSAHVQLNALLFFRENRVVINGLPSRTSHRLQPLDVGVFSSFKSNLQAAVHRAAQMKKVLDAFDVGHCITDAYSKSVTMSNIRNGFQKTGTYVSEEHKASISPLEWWFGDDKETEPTLHDVMTSYNKSTRSMLRDANVEENGVIRINTERGAN